MQIMSAMSSSVRFKSLRNDKQRQQLTDTAQPNSKRHLAKSRHSWKERDFVNLREPPPLLLGRIVLVQLHSVLGGGPRPFVSFRLLFHRNVTILFGAGDARETQATNRSTRSRGAPSEKNSHISMKQQPKRN